MSEPIKRRERDAVLQSLQAGLVPKLGLHLIVAIDAPPVWAKRGNCRQAEQELRKLGVQSFATPSDPDKQASSFYDWMREGFRVYRSIARKFPRYRAGRAKGTAIEVFPHATAVFLASRKRPRNIKKHRWRMAICCARESIQHLSNPKIKLMQRSPR